MTWFAREHLKDLFYEKHSSGYFYLSDCIIFIINKKSRWLQNQEKVNNFQYFQYFLFFESSESLARLTKTF